MKTKIKNKDRPARHLRTEKKLSDRRNTSYSSGEDDFNLELYNMMEDAGIENVENNYYDLGSDDYYYLEIEEG